MPRARLHPRSRRRGAPRRLLRPLELGDRLAHPRGRLRDDEIWGGMPAVGDWVVVCDAPGDRFAIEALLPRRTKVSRKTPWLKAEEHILAANVDTVFLVSGLDADFNPRRLERYLTAAWDSGADPVIVLTKLDVRDDPGSSPRPRRSRRRSRLRGQQRHRGGARRRAALLEPAKTFVLSARPGREVDAREPARRPDRDGDRRPPQRRARPPHDAAPAAAVMPGGAILIDTPGLRELQVWEGDLDSAFADIAELAAQCRFNDCAHSTEPDCAVREALETGELDPDRWRNYLKLQRELRAIEARRAVGSSASSRAGGGRALARPAAPAATEGSPRPLLRRPA